MSSMSIHDTLDTRDASTSSLSPTLEPSTSPSSLTDSGSVAESQALFDATQHSADDYDSVMDWEHYSSEQLAIPKLEPADEDSLCLDNLQQAPADFQLSSDVQEVVVAIKRKRPRGRPRKPCVIPPAPPSAKITKGRSKTGCITCRKRKKKCDEAKPRCMNCEKNAVVCEGYPEKQVWKSGKERAEEELLKTQSLPVITMQPIFVGLETAEDRIFWKHYNDNLSTVFTMEGECRNAFQEMLVPLATRHHGLMHSILSLSSRHLDFATPYGAKILRKSPKVTLNSLQRRGEFHADEAIDSLCRGMDNIQNDDSNQKDSLAAHYGQILCLVLQSLAIGALGGANTSHYIAFLFLIKNSPPQDAAFHAFIVEFFYFHILADDLLYCPQRLAERSIARLTSEHWPPPTPIQPERLIGVADDLLHLMSQTTSVRNRVRGRIASHTEPRVDYESLYQASDIEGAIFDWAPSWPEGDSRKRVTLLYKQMAWLYLKTTICPPSSSSSTVPSTWSLGAQSGTAITDTPPQSASASCASSPSPKLEALYANEDHTGNPRRHSIANPKMTNGSRLFRSRLDSNPVPREDSDPPASPPPIRRPANHETGVTMAVGQALAILESFSPSDPAQTFLLIPAVIIGVACYAPSERDRIRQAIRAIHGYTGLRNAHQALALLTEVWRLMDSGEYLKAWDWQAVAHSLDIENLF